MVVKTMSLKDENYEITEGSCPDCEDGSLWVNMHELVCGHCHLVFRDGTNPQMDDDFPDPTEPPAVEFYKNRFGDSSKHRYSNSGSAILPGGFEDAYEGDDEYGINRDDSDELLDTRRV